MTLAVLALAASLPGDIIPDPQRSQRSNKRKCAHDKPSCVLKVGIVTGQVGKVTGDVRYQEMELAPGTGPKATLYSKYHCWQNVQPLENNTAHHCLLDCVAIRAQPLLPRSQNILPFCKTQNLRKLSGRANPWTLKGMVMICFNSYWF